MLKLAAARSFRRVGVAVSDIEGVLMVRAVLVLLLGVTLAGCSRGDLTALAENVRIRAENIGAEAEFRRQSALTASQEYGTVYVPQEKEGLAEAADAEKAAPEKKVPPPPPTVYVVVPAS